MGKGFMALEGGEKTGRVSTQTPYEFAHAWTTAPDVTLRGGKNNNQQNSSIWKADFSSGSNGDRSVSMELKNAPLAAPSTFSQS
ncbi:hypothetical protein L5515_014612 [Caenorhabditis briggsae]|uniref:Uncharacterized protein n=1 Tax=Caenorhabditis briggsae TaxID=6238 RepID=A0AAE9J8T2_CAEBR|nr:hypothetical protein L5515_014612 [Caenorhabditis briggsae]